MIIVFLRRIEWFIALALLQVLVLNNVHIAGYATPFLYIYLIVKMSSGVSRNELVLWGFFLGLVIDVFSNTPGMNAAATTFIAFIRPYLLRLFSPRDISDEIVPAIKTIGVSPFIKYVVTCVLFHHASLLLIDSFSFFEFSTLLIKIGSSTLLTVVCVMCIEGFKK
ncbi:rod shape-determining protein MreD [uncultured Bacteroides sp.]|uniref:rod shape-determining protein MreD n=1 Tax=uncultured Bacteroides sp. TaxID=162156 RepID=UPI002AAC1EE3|nr:rod shape-determining protein MreD [uncultured Bacteroides sp.]